MISSTIVVYSGEPDEKEMAKRGKIIFPCSRMGMVNIPIFQGGEDFPNAIVLFLYFHAKINCASTCVVLGGWGYYNLKIISLMTNM